MQETRARKIRAIEFQPDWLRGMREGRMLFIVGVVLLIVVLIGTGVAVLALGALDPTWATFLWFLAILGVLSSALILAGIYMFMTSTIKAAKVLAAAASPPREAATPPRPWA